MSRILLVDDDADFLQLLSMRLNSAGYETDLALSAEKALAVLPAFCPELVVTDLRMEGMDGIALFRKIREQKPFLPVIIMTAHGSIPEAVAATKEGVFSFQTKPIDSKALLSEIQRALALGGTTAGLESSADDEWRRDIISQSTVMADLLTQTKLVAASKSNIFIHGESGTGKELLAQAIHRASPRAQKPFVALNCGAIPEALLESELFGHVKGSFTGAVRDYPGMIKSAQGGTLLLDEIGDTPLPFQIKLLRVIQERKVRPVGSTVAADVDVRIISATHQDIDAMLENGTFREDLYYRLNVIRLKIPPLTERREDIPLLCRHFLQEINEESQKEINGFTHEAMDLVVSAPWPGNVRQLYNVVEHSAALASGPLISVDIVQMTLQKDFVEIPTFNEARQRFEQEYLISLMKMTDGNVSRAARIAKRNRTDFYKILQRNHITPSLFSKPKS